jgi:hypothetical protein
MEAAVLGKSSNMGLYIAAGVGLLAIVAGYYYRDRLKNYMGTFCAAAQQGDQSPKLGELSGGGIVVFKKWANAQYNLGLDETKSAPDAMTTTAYVEHGREFLQALTDSYSGGQ